VLPSMNYIVQAFGDGLDANGSSLPGVLFLAIRRITPAALSSTAHHWSHAAIGVACFSTSAPRHKPALPSGYGAGVY
jgi:hypothetical protein